MGVFGPPQVFLGVGNGRSHKNMSLNQDIRAITDDISPKMKEWLGSQCAEKQLLALMVLIRRMRPVSVEVMREGQVMAEDELVELLRTTSQQLKREQNDSEQAGLGFRLKGKIPKSLKIGQKISIQAEIIDKKGCVSQLKSDSVCRLTVTNTEETEKYEVRQKRTREEIVCGVTEVELGTASLISFTDISFSQSSSLQPNGVYQLTLHCEGVTSLSLPPIRVSPY